MLRGSYMMKNCPDYNVTPGSYFYLLFLDGFALISIIIHPYTMYCIVCKSPVQMKTYRWYLLWHQIVACLGDLWVRYTPFTQIKILF